METPGAPGSGYDLNLAGLQLSWIGHAFDAPTQPNSYAATSDSYSYRYSNTPTYPHA